MATEPVGRPLTLDPGALRAGVAHLTKVDARLATMGAGHGVPPLWPRPEGFATLVKVILEQQVSLDSAAAAYARLEDVLGRVEPARFLACDDTALRRIGFSRQKAAYCRGLASGIRDGTIDLAAIGSLSDDAARRALIAVRGIGSWSADVYLLFALRRPDVWPRGDRALVVSMAENLPLPAVPDHDAAARIASRWRPYRAVAARMFWHAYLVKRGRGLD